MTPLALVLTLDTSDIGAALSSSYCTSADASYSLAVWAHDLVYSNLVCLGAKKCMYRVRSTMPLKSFS